MTAAEKAMWTSQSWIVTISSSQSELNVYRDVSFVNGTSSGDVDDQGSDVWQVQPHRFIFEHILAQQHTSNYSPHVTNSWVSF